MKKSGATATPVKPGSSEKPLPKIVSIESLRAQRDAARNADGTDGSASQEIDRDALVAQLRAEQGDLPDVRLEKIVEAKLRHTRGYYDSDQVRLDILGALFEEERANPPAAPAAGRIPSGSAAAKTPPGSAAARTPSRSASAKTPSGSASAKTPSGSASAKRSKSATKPKAGARTRKKPD
jgi:hypothetical protein